MGAALETPLVLPLTLNSERRYILVYAGSRESGRKLLHQVRRHARFALIDGLPYRQYWEEDLENFRDRCLLTDQQWNVLSPEDEQEVEQLFLDLRRESARDAGGTDPGGPHDDRFGADAEDRRRGPEGQNT